MISATIRDIAIIIIAVQTIVIGVLLGVLIWQIWRLVKMLQTEIKPIISDTQETLSTVRGTATFVSNNVVDPVVKTGSALVRYRRTFQSLTGELFPRRAPARQTAPPPSMPEGPTHGSS
ncbi:MAG: hypothetical protein KJZ93_28120 [Caldilineaceae bacterium]|nr:hypothetical protein [Caldilineaceae bacterium]